MQPAVPARYPPAVPARYPPAVVQHRPADWPPPVIDPEALAEYPVPVQLMVATAVLPLEVALTSVKILKNTEALLGELVFHLNALRPAVAGVGEAYANGQFDQVFRTIDQIQQGTNAFALVWAPFNAVRDRLPGLPVDIPITPTPHRHPAPPVPALPPAPQPPTTAEWLGRIGGQVWDQANTLPGAGMVTGPLRRVGSALADGSSRPAAPEEVPVTTLAPPVEDEPEESRPSRLLGPVRWLLGR